MRLYLTQRFGRRIALRRRLPARRQVRPRRSSGPGARTTRQADRLPRLLVRLARAVPRQRADQV